MSDLIDALARQWDAEPEDRVLICAYTPSRDIHDPDFEAWMAAMEAAGWPDPPLPYPLAD
jgi:hypothetical protein